MLKYNLGFLNYLGFLPLNTGPGEETVGLSIFPDVQLGHGQSIHPEEWEKFPRHDGLDVPM